MGYLSYGLLLKTFLRSALILGPPLFSSCFSTGPESPSAQSTTANAAASVATAAPACAPEKTLSVKVTGTLHRSARAFTEGLFLDRGKLWESGGAYNRASTLNSIDPATGKVTALGKFPGTTFAEGVALFDDRLYVLTYTEHLIYVFDRSGRKILETRTSPLPSEGWGLTTDQHSLIASDGSANIYWIDPKSLNITRSIEVRSGSGLPQFALNELEWVDGKIFANIFQSTDLVEIDSNTGCIVARANLSPFYQTMGCIEHASRVECGIQAVANGIAYDPAKKRFFLTGKDWPLIFIAEISDAAP
jgi:glutamine cyclotransferase